jgi:hypothetical protein
VVRETERADRVRRRRRLPRGVIPLAKMVPNRVGLAGEIRRRRDLFRLHELAKSTDVPEYAFALVQTSLGEKERAIEALERSYNGGNRSYLFILPVDPLLDDLRSDPRFETLVQKITAPKTGPKS